MATVTKLTPTGIQYSNELDEVTFNVNSGFKKNLFQTSQNITSGWYVAQDTIFKENVATAPDGTFTADVIIGIAGITGRKSIYQNINLIAGQTYTYSIYLKSAGFINATMWFDSANVLPGAYQGAGAIINLIDGTKSGGTPSQTTVTFVGNGWYRCVVTATPTVSGGMNFQLSCGEANGSGTARGDAISGLYVWGFQLELGSQATIYEATGTNAIPLSGPANRVDANGKIYISGSFDEITFNPNSGIKKNLIINSPIIDLVQWGTNGSAAAQRVDILGPGNVPTIVSRISNPAILTNSDNCAVSQQPTITSGINVNYTFSIYVKKDVSDITNIYLFYQPTTRGSFLQYTFSTDTIVVGPADGGGITPTIYGRILYPNGWIRLYFSVNDSTLGTNTSLICRLYPGSRNTFRSSDSTFYWGPQLELGTSPSIYEATGANAIPLTNVAMKMESTGNTYTIGSYDEITGILPITDNLLMSYDVAFANSSSILYDASGFNNNVTMVNSPLLIENFFRLNGSTQYGNITPRSLNQPYSGKTIFAILRLDSSITLSGSTFRGFIGSNTNNRNFNTYILTDASGHRIHYSTGPNGVWLGGNSNYLSITAGRWFTVAITQDSTGSGNYYCNGVSVGTISNALAQYAPNTFEFFGAADNNFFGDISHISVYKRGLSADEISTLHNTFKFRFGI